MLVENSGRCNTNSEGEKVLNTFLMACSCNSLNSQWCRYHLFCPSVNGNWLLTKPSIHVDLSFNLKPKVYSWKCMARLLVTNDS